MDEFWQSLAMDEPALAGSLAKLRARSTPLRLAKGERLFSIGETPARMYFVVDGEVRLVRVSRAGGEAILQRSRRGFVAEASLDAARYHCDGVVATASSVMAFPVTDFRRLLGDDAAFRAAWAAHLAHEVRRLRAKCERLSLKRAEARILHYLETEAGGDGLLVSSRKAWAAELGLTHEALYRTVARLRATGAIRVDGKRIALVS